MRSRQAIVRISMLSRSNEPSGSWKQKPETTTSMRSLCGSSSKRVFGRPRPRFRAFADPTAFAFHLVFAAPRRVVGASHKTGQGSLCETEQRRRNEQTGGGSRARGRAKDDAMAGRVSEGARGAEVRGGRQVGKERRCGRRGGAVLAHGLRWIEDGGGGGGEPAGRCVDSQANA